MLLNLVDRDREGLPIAPIWNWNSVCYKLVHIALCYQSHQSGIETRFCGVAQGFLNGYQSHQSGIETCDRSHGKFDLLATNRTNLELKLLLAVDTVAKFVCYQSHQSGIETPWSRHQRCRIQCYQSHQSGIETVPDRGNIIFDFATNRTNLELKLYYFWPGTFPPPSTNRTNLELKLPCENYTWSRICYQSHQSGIETSRLPPYE